MERDPREHIAGPTLYLEADGLNGGLCPLVFEDGGEEYRIVQLTSAHAFDTLAGAFEDHLGSGVVPSEAAVIAVTPSAERDAEVATVGDTTLLGFSIDPFDLTGISIAFSKLLDRWEPRDGTTRICLQGIETLLQYHDTDLVYRFLNTVVATLQGAGAEVHMHLGQATIDDRTTHMLSSLFDRTIDPEDERPAPGTSAEATATHSNASGEFRSAATDDPVDLPSEAAAMHATEMTDAEIDAFLASEGLGILAFGGDSPYTIPMTYGFDPADRTIIFQLGAFTGSEKAARLEADDAVAFAVVRYERPDRWRSVVVDGRLTSITAEQAEARDVFEHFSAGRLASVDVFTRDLEEVELDWYILEDAAFSGRKSVGEVANP